MENASKALIIAGAILISIILISVGIMVVQSAGGIVGTGTTKMNQQEIQAFNSDYLNYSGTQKGSAVKQLIQLIISNNAANKDDTDKVISVNSQTSGTELSKLMNGVQPTRNYNVEITIDDNTGLVHEIKY